MTPKEREIMARLKLAPSFTGGGTDSHAYGMFVWVRGSKMTRMEWIDEDSLALSCDR